MENTTYRVTRLTIAEISLIALGGLFCFFGLTDLAWDYWRAGGFAAALSQYPYNMSAAAAQILLGLAMAYVFWLASMKKRGNAVLKLGGAGVFLSDGRLRREWRWDEVSAVKLERGWLGRHIVLSPSGAVVSPGHGADAGPRLPEGPPVKIRDIWDTPLDEVAATLNAYRERALDSA